MWPLFVVTKVITNWMIKITWIYWVIWSEWDVKNLDQRLIILISDYINWLLMYDNGYIIVTSNFNLKIVNDGTFLFHLRFTLTPLLSPPWTSSLPSSPPASSSPSWATSPRRWASTSSTLQREVKDSPLSHTLKPFRGCRFRLFGPSSSSSCCSSWASTQSLPSWRPSSRLSTMDSQNWEITR